MAEQARAIDISTMAEVIRLAEEVARTGKSHELADHGTVLAVLSPVRPRRRESGAMRGAELKRVLATTYGAWNELVDPDKFEQRRRELQVDDRDSRML